MAYLSLTLFAICLTFTESLIHLKNGHSVDYCAFFPIGENYWDFSRTKYWFPTVHASLVATILLYFVPAVLCIGLYARVCHVLLKRRQQASRNKVLTIALLFSCLFWIALWGLAYFLRFSDTYLPCLIHTLFICLTGHGVEEDGVDVRINSNCPQGINIVWNEVKKANTLLATFSAVLNAACLLIICKKFWQPLIAAFHASRKIWLVIKEKTYGKQHVLLNCKKDPLKCCFPSNNP